MIAVGYSAQSEARHHMLQVVTGYNLKSDSVNHNAVNASASQPDYIGAMDVDMWCTNGTHLKGFTSVV